MTEDYNKFWKQNISEIAKEGKRYGWFRRKKYAHIARLFPKFILKRFPARKYQFGVASISEGFLCDLGCGLGGTSALYHALRNKPVIGADISIEAIRFANMEKQRLGFTTIKFIVSDITHTPFKKGLFDTVYLGQVLEHVPDEHKVLKEAMRILKPNGILIISIPKEDMLPSPYHVREYKTNDVEKLLSAYSKEKPVFYDFDPRRFVVSIRIK